MTGWMPRLSRIRPARLLLPALSLVLLATATDYLVTDLIRHPPGLGGAVAAPNGFSTAPLLPVSPESRPGARHGRYVGFSVTGFPPDFTRLQGFIQATKVQPGVVSLYQSVGAPFDVSAVADIASIGALPLIQINPRTPLAGIAAGHADSWLRSYARAVRSFGRPLAIGFAHEFNGDWYPWSFRHVRPVTFRRAWRHIHDVFARQGARNVIWVWTANLTMESTTALRPFWPGDAYVSWVGLDGYFFPWSPGFGPLFEPTISQVRAFTKRPILLTETGISPGPNRPARIGDLFQGVAQARRQGVIGLIWFDYSRVEGHNWRIDGDPASEAAFAMFARIYRNGHA